MFLKGLFCVLIWFVAADTLAMTKGAMYTGTLETIYEQAHVNNVLNGLMLGTLLAMMIFNLYIYIAIKNRSYLYYLGYTFFCILFLTVQNGYFNSFFPSLSLHALSASAAGALVFSILFTNGYLRTPHYAPILFQLGKWLIPAFLIPVGVDLAGSPQSAFRLLQISSAFAAIYWLSTGYISLRKGFKPAAYYLIAACLLLMSCFFPEVFRIPWGLQTGLCLQALTLSLMLAVNLNHLKVQTTQLQRKMVAQTADFSKALLIGQENEKEKIADELNKEIGQQLVQLKNEIYVLKKQNPEVQHELFDEIREDIGKAIEEVSTVSFSLRPYQMNTLGLKLAIESLVENISASTEIFIQLDIDDIGQLPTKAMEMNIYRVIQELLNNLIKHSAATQCRINLKNKNGHLTFYYRDNGKGFNTDNISTGLGLLSITERCAIMNANLKLRSKQGSGTQFLIKIEMPLTNKLDKDEYHRTDS